MTGMDSVRDLLDGGQRPSRINETERLHPGMAAPARYAPPEETP